MNIKILFLLSLTIAQKSFCMENELGNPKEITQSLEQNRFALYRINMIQLIDWGLTQKMSVYRDDLISQFLRTRTFPKQGFRSIEQDLIKNFTLFNQFFPGKAIIADEWTGQAVENFRFAMAKTKISLEQEIARQEDKKYIPAVKIESKVYPAPDFLEIVTWQFALWSLDQRSKSKK